MTKTKPKFFIPAAEDKQQEDRVYDAIKEFLSSNLGADFDKRQVFCLNYVHEGKTYEAEVGKPHSLNGEVVIAILHEPVRRLFHVCTANRGVFRGMSILVGKHSVRSCQNFAA